MGPVGTVEHDLDATSGLGRRAGMAGRSGWTAWPFGWRWDRTDRTYKTDRTDVLRGCFAKANPIREGVSGGFIGVSE